MSAQKQEQGPFKCRPTVAFKKGQRVVVVLGAGATKACDGALTNEILPIAFKAAGKQKLALLEEFLIGVFGVPMGSSRKPQDYPPLPTLLSLIDTAIDREYDLGREWPTQRLRQVRRQAEFAVFKSIGHAMRKPKSWAISAENAIWGHGRRRGIVTGHPLKPTSAVRFAKSIKRVRLTFPTFY